MLKRFAIAATLIGAVCLTSSFVSQPDRKEPVKSEEPAKSEEQKPAEKPAVKRQPEKTILFFTAGWCQACQRFKNGPLALLRKAGWTEKHIREVSDQATFDKYDIRVLPTFILTVDGKEISRRTGYMDQWEIGEFHKSTGETSIANWRSAVVQIGGCSGVCIHPSGIFLTVKHCRVPQKTTLTIDGQTVNVARIFESRGEGPVILAAVEPGMFPYLKLAKLLPKVNDLVYSLGYPAGSGEHRRIYTISEVRYLGQDKGGFLMTNHVTIPGNSGGPLLNERGEVIGLLSSSTWNTIGKTPPKSYWVPRGEIIDALKTTRTKYTALLNLKKGPIPWARTIVIGLISVSGVVLTAFFGAPLLIIVPLTAVLKVIAGAVL